MVWDLRTALVKKQEVETARLIDFEFRVRARAMRLLAEKLALPPSDLIARVARHPDCQLLAGIAAETTMTLSEIEWHHRRCADEARRQLIAERGDPAPHRLA